MKKVIEKIIPLQVQLDGLEKELKSRGEKPKYPLTSLPELSKKIWGFKEGLTVIGARSSHGKSAMAAQIAYDFAGQGIATLFLSLEMTEQNILERLFCYHARINNYALQSGQFNNYKKQWDNFKEVISSMKLMITCGIGQSWKEVNFMVQELNPKPKCIIIDYIQGVSTNSREHREMLNEYIRKFREMALLNKFVGIICSQINRGAMQDKNKEPALWTLKETGGLEESADMVILMHYDYKYTNDEATKNDIKLIIAKSRNGATGVHNIKIDPKNYRFYEDEKEMKSLEEIGKLFKENL